MHAASDGCRLYRQRWRHRYILIVNRRLTDEYKEEECDNSCSSTEAYSHVSSQLCRRRSAANILRMLTVVIDQLPDQSILHVIGQKIRESTQTVQTSSRQPSWNLRKVIFRAKITSAGLPNSAKIILYAAEPSGNCTPVFTLNFDLDLWKVNTEIWHRC